MSDRPLDGRRWWLACGLVFLLAMAALSPSTGDFGLTYDEPAYRHSQVVSVQWWERLAEARSRADLEAILSPDALLYYWPYGRFGINFHPPLAGQLNLLTHAIFGGIMKDMPSRRMASVIEFALTVTILFGFLARRYGAWVGGISSASLLLMPRLYGQAHLIDTDIPGLLLWVATAFAAWDGLQATGGRGWRVLLGVLVGLAFVEKMAAVLVLLPILGWLAMTRLPRAFRRGDGPAWLDAAITLGSMLAPLVLAFLDVRRMAIQMPEPGRTNLFRDAPAPFLPGAILAAPLAVWVVRRMLGRVFRTSAIWGVERPGLELVAEVLAFAPVVAWLGNPAWWRDTLPRLAHYYAISAARKGVLPDIQILYFGEIYKYSLPWPNAWVLMAITVPTGILAAAIVGVVWKLAGVRSDRLPLYFLVQLVTLPTMRMLETPAHDGVRLFLPTFAFLAAFAGWGAVGLADGVVTLFRLRRPAIARGVIAAAVLGPAAWDLAAIHPYELSYYNRLIGGPRGAWERGFELTYWYDAFTPGFLERINRELPEGAYVDFPNELSAPSTFQELQSLGELDSDLHLEQPEEGFPHLWLLTHDSKAMAFTRLLFAMEPELVNRPRQLGGLPVAAVMGPEAASRALALQLLAEAPSERLPEPRKAPAWARGPLARFWGDGLDRARPPAVNRPIFDWAERDPAGLKAAARRVVEASKSRGGTVEPSDYVGNPDAERLARTITRYDGATSFSRLLLARRPVALLEAAAILAERAEAVRAVLTRAGFTDPERIGGYLDRDLPALVRERP